MPTISPQSLMLQGAQNLQAFALQHLLQAGLSPLEADAQGVSSFRHVAGDAVALGWAGDPTEHGETWRAIFVAMAQATPRTVAERAERTRGWAAALEISHRNAVLMAELQAQADAQGISVNPSALAGLRKTAVGASWLIDQLKACPPQPGDLPAETTADRAEQEQVLHAAERRAFAQAREQLGKMHWTPEGELAVKEDASPSVSKPSSAAQRRRP